MAIIMRNSTIPMDSLVLTTTHLLQTRTRMCMAGMVVTAVMAVMVATVALVASVQCLLPSQSPYATAAQAA